MTVQCGVADCLNNVRRVERGLCAKHWYQLKAGCLVEPPEEDPVTEAWLNVVCGVLRELGPCKQDMTSEHMVTILMEMNRRARCVLGIDLVCLDPRTDVRPVLARLRAG